MNLYIEEMAFLQDFTRKNDIIVHHAANFYR